MTQKYLRQKSKSLIDKPRAKNMSKQHRNDNQALKY